MSTPLQDAPVAEKRCMHKQAGLVMTDSGDVDYLCVTCLVPLPDDYIDRQRNRAARKAFCTHEDFVFLSGPDGWPRRMCIRCGADLP